MNKSVRDIVERFFVRQGRWREGVAELRRMTSDAA